MQKITVIGAGSWGLALARLLAKQNQQVSIWDKDTDALSHLRINHKHPRLLPGFVLPDNVMIAETLEESIQSSEEIVLTIPSHVMRAVCTSIKPYLSHGHILISCAKGLEMDTLKTMSEVIQDVLPELSSSQITALSGPSHAEEVSMDIPTTVSVSGSDIQVLAKIQDIFSTRFFRVYTNMDLVGVEMGAALKNVIAIAAGACDGMGFGDNTKAALITRGLAEMTRLGVKKGANPATFSGLSGLGDLVVTCMSRHSRNRMFGELKAKGFSTDEALQKIGMVVEGLKTSEAAKKLSDKLEVEMPITNEIYNVIHDEKSVKQAVMDLMTRDPKSERENF